MFTIVLLYVLGMSLAILAARLYTRRPLTATDRWCASVDADLDARSVPVVAERRAA